MEKIINPQQWAEFGLIGLVVFALFMLVVFLVVESRRGRGEFLAALREIMKTVDSRQKESNQRQDETNKAISGLAVVIERNTGRRN